MHRLTETFVRVADQVDRAVTFATVGTGIVGFQPDHFVAAYGFRVMGLFCGGEVRVVLRKMLSDEDE